MRAARHHLVAAVVGVAAFVGGGASADLWVHHGSEHLPGDLPVDSLDEGIALPFTVAVPAARGCPDYAFDAPLPDPGAVGPTSDRTFHLSASPMAAILVVCLPDAGGSAEAVVAHHLAVPISDGTHITDGPVLVRSAFGEAFRIDTQFGTTGPTIREWYTDHDGVVIVVGLIFYPGADVAGSTSIVESMLTSWTWHLRPVDG
ncbi:hypothetical protein [Cellulomonas sp. URHE0023]|uniref:hypothetical protein n=1 Tax=Cellulomonas sp. URHE0023 TaxID=1380354 RepID=UPI000485178C|nr:hypothetical protein [Cellulomonas sp. URHE0023]